MYSSHHSEREVVRCRGRCRCRCRRIVLSSTSNPYEPADRTSATRGPPQFPDEPKQPSPSIPHPPSPIPSYMLLITRAARNCPELPRTAPSLAIVVAGMEAIHPSPINSLLTSVTSLIKSQPDPEPSHHINHSLFRSGLHTSLTSARCGAIPAPDWTPVPPQPVSARCPVSAQRAPPGDLIHKPTRAPVFPIILANNDYVPLSLWLFLHLPDNYGSVPRNFDQSSFLSVHFSFLSSNHPAT